MKLKRANAPHHGMGEHGHAKRMGGLMAGAHMPLRKNSGYDDRKGYKGSAQAAFGSKQSGRAPKVSPDAGHFHPIGHGSTRQFSEDTSDTRRMNREVTSHEGSERRDGYHTGKPSKGDTRRRIGPEGNSKGSPPTNLKSGKPASLEAHKGTSGRGGSGRHGKGDSYTGKATPMSESPTSDWFEKLGTK